MFSRLFFYFKWATYLNQLSAQNEQADLISLGPWGVNEWKGVCVGGELSLESLEMTTLAHIPF